ncbi:hypothetical protein BM1_06616 [Bipolaris maydis]|nr:hypothetical protein BM1_06616 [Bipolaris maydis]
MENAQPGHTSVTQIPSFNLRKALHYPRLLDIIQFTRYYLFILTMVEPTSNTSDRSSSVTLTPRPSSSSVQHHALSASSLRSALKKPFQGWSKELLRARDNDDDDYNFSSGMRRGAQDYNDEA